ncbi:MAG: sugar ABC transporter substrate-binding protein [Nitrospirales bacterium]|nr:MAG: sugar ABC transporter substrate-binding protein [Nitrospirales bacterium]
MLLLNVLFIFLTACSSLDIGVNALGVSDLGEEGLPRLSKDGITKGEDSVANRDKQYVIKPGDELSIKFFFNPELNEEELIVRPDGRISLQLIHEVEAADLTASQLRDLLVKRYVGQIKTPEIAVIVRSVREHPFVYVDGEVSRPGIFEYRDSLSVLQVVALAGGFKDDTAKKDEIIVIRLDQNKKPVVIKLNIDSSLSGRDLTQNISLLPNDFIYVPRSFW